LLDKNVDGKLSAARRAAARRLLRERREKLADERQPERMTWKVVGLDREALVYLPTNKSDNAAPLVFGFHGHGGSAQQAARSYGLHQLWPDAIVVYMQGVPTAGRLTDPEGKRNGWQHDADENGARDLKFFDAVLATLREKHKVDDRRVYATGHSNGGGFTYLLWANLPEIFAAIAPSAAGSRSLRTSKPNPVPVLHVAGKQDQLVKYTWQQFTMQRVREINKCGNEGKQWAKGCTIYSAEDGVPFVSYIHDGTHKYPAEAPELIVRFFKEHAQPAKAASP
jgi:polyhydroxybutyrate depolymerase